VCEREREGEDVCVCAHRICHPLTYINSSLGAKEHTWRNPLDAKPSSPLDADAAEEPASASALTAAFIPHALRVFQAVTLGQSCRTMLEVELSTHTAAAGDQAAVIDREGPFESHRMMRHQPSCTTPAGAPCSRRAERGKHDAPGGCAAGGARGDGVTEATMDDRMVCSTAVTQPCACASVSADRRYSCVGRLMYQHPGGEMLARPARPHAPTENPHAPLSMRRCFARDTQHCGSARSWG
jgi:hypothetical protein